MADELIVMIKESKDATMFNKKVVLACVKEELAKQRIKIIEAAKKKVKIDVAILHRIVDTHTHYHNGERCFTPRFYPAFFRTMVGSKEIINFKGLDKMKEVTSG